VAQHHQKLPAYECELIGFIKDNMMFLLDQRMSTIPQHTWVYT
jgi:hypothetical protein